MQKLHFLTLIDCCKANLVHQQISPWSTTTTLLQTCSQPNAASQTLAQSTFLRTVERTAGKLLCLAKDADHYQRPCPQSPTNGYSNQIKSILGWS